VYDESREDSFMDSGWPRVGRELCGLFLCSSGEQSRSGCFAGYYCCDFGVRFGVGIFVVVAFGLFPTMAIVTQTTNSSPSA
jgi:hypothetical protein